MRSRWLFILLAASLAAAPATQPAQTGDFSVVFDQRSPLSDYQKLQARLNGTAQEIGPDYRLADEPFQVYVPADYDGSVPLGVIVYIVPDGTPDGYRGLMPVLRRHHLIFIGPRKGNLPIGQATGLCLDAVFNLEQSYRVDPERIYLIGANDSSQVMGMCLSDVFAGDVTIWAFSYFRKIDNLWGFPILPKPPDALLEMSKTRVHILAFDTDPSRDYFRQHYPEAMMNDGFALVVNNEVTHEEMMHRGWLDERLLELESAPGQTDPAETEAPASRPSEAESLLKTAELDIDNQQFVQAREKLDEIIQKYPDDPACEKAQELLSQMQGQ